MLTAALGLEAADRPGPLMLASEVTSSLAALVGGGMPACLSPATAGLPLATSEAAVVGFSAGLFLQPIQNVNADFAEHSIQTYQ